jgi:hypothetical protein
MMYLLQLRPNRTAIAHSHVSTGDREQRERQKTGLEYLLYRAVLIC